MKRNELIKHINRGFKSKILKSMTIEIFKNLDNKKTIDELYCELTVYKLHTMKYYFSDEFLDKIIYEGCSLKNTLMELNANGIIENYEFEFYYNNKGARREMVLNAISQIVVKRIIQFIEEL